MGALEVMKQHSGIRKSHKILEGGKWTIIESTNKPFDLSFNISFATHNHPRQQQNFLSISVQLFILLLFWARGSRGFVMGSLELDYVEKPTNAWRLANTTQNVKFTIRFQLNFHEEIFINYNAQNLSSSSSSYSLEGWKLFLFPSVPPAPFKLPSLFHIRSLRLSVLCSTQQQAIAVCRKKRKRKAGDGKKSNSINYWSMESTAQTLLDHKIFFPTFVILRTCES